jgi:hypothetical protein
VVVTARYCGVDRLKRVLTSRRCRPVNAALERPSWTARAPSAGDHVGANPVDRGKPGSKIQLVCEGHGLPLTAAVTAADVADVTMLPAALATTITSEPTPHRNHGSTSTRNSPPGARATSMSLVRASKQASHSTATPGLDVP